MAMDLADRLLPAFSTRTGIPYSRVNLRYGVEENESRNTCTACAGTLLIEFGLLSRLVDNPLYETVARKALLAIWNRRSKLGLFGNTIDTHTGQWKIHDSGIGAGSDSFYEYLFKSYLFFDNMEYYVMFNESYQKAMQYFNYDNWYFSVDMNSGTFRYFWVDSLSAFWAGLQAIVGDVEKGKQTHAKYLRIWNKYGAVPERYDVLRGVSVSGLNNYPLRPEFVESTYLLYQSTKDPYYLEIGVNILRSLQKYKVECGYASMTLAKDLKSRQPHPNHLHSNQHIRNHCIRGEYFPP
eukprot:TRINITY_DN8582_c0_g2_i2.p1 TRINITY_DN8582_c0_g2~~TRINITY_DN8582_c0_g2_i2.p1  ORF type:complete len:318 (-),score=70.98 TRINITY_DN8582_c0_g2_i2:30-914(-)